MPSTLHLAHEEHEHADDNENRQAGQQQLAPEAGLFRLAADNFNPVGEQVIDQFGVFQHGADSLETAIVEALATDSKAINDYLFDLISLNFLNKLGIYQLFRWLLRIEILEYRQQHGRNYQPQQ